MIHHRHGHPRPDRIAEYLCPDKPLLGHTNDFKRLPTDAQGAPHRLWVPAEHPMPVVMTNDDDWMRSRPSIVGFPEQPSARGRYT